LRMTLRATTSIRMLTVGLLVSDGDWTEISNWTCIMRGQRSRVRRE
jgi:hypothetical protein